jgi:hypothetical protein
MKDAALRCTWRALGARHGRRAGLALVLMLSFAVAPGVGRAEIGGIVVDRASGEPIAGARVSVQASGDFVLSRSNGIYRLPNAEGVLINLTAAHVGYFTGSQRASTGDTGVRIELEAVPQQDNPHYVFKSPTTCSLCHIVQFEQWDDSPMARTGTNTWLYDIYDGSGTAGGHNGFVYTRDSAHASVNPSSECTSCHQPERCARNRYLSQRRHLCRGQFPQR